MWIAKNVEEQPTEFSEHKLKYTKLWARKYHLADPTGASNTIQVCKPFFLSTLGKKTASMVDTALREQRSNRIAPGPDQRGGARKQRADLMNDETIIGHIESYHPSISHYTRKNAPNRRYLNPELTIREMWNNFITKYPNGCSETKYRNIFSASNIGFSIPSLDQCHICINYKAHKEECESDHNQAQCATCQEHLPHITRYTEARIEYQKPLPKDAVVFAGDMQRVLVLPILDTKEHVFVSRLITYNQTFAARTPG